MATRSTIAALCEDGKVRSIYCHWDGYLEGVGVELKSKFNTQEMIEDLISNGSLSTLCGEVLSHHEWRGDTIHINEFESFYEYITQRSYEEFNYYWNGSMWYYSEDESNSFEQVP